MVERIGDDVDPQSQVDPKIARNPRKYLVRPEHGRHRLAEAGAVGIAARALPEGHELHQEPHPVVSAPSRDAENVLEIGL